MAVTFNSGTAPQIQVFTEQICQGMGQATLDLSHSASFKINLETRDGQELHAQIIPLDQGITPAKFKVALPTDLVVPSGDPADLDGYTGTSTLVASTKDITIPTPTYGGVAVPTTALIGAMQITPAGVPRFLKAIRISNTAIRVFSDGISYNRPTDMDTWTEALVDGTKTVTMNDTVATTDKYFVEQVTAGGNAATNFSAFRAGASTVTVFAHNDAGAKVAGNTSTVRVHKFPVSAASTYTITGTLVLGAADMLLANVAGDRLVAVAETAAGTAANHYVVFRKSATEVTVHAQTILGALQTGSTSVVRVFNLGQPDCATVTLAVGTGEVLLTTGATDVYATRVISSLGGAAACYSVNRKDANTLTINAQNAAGAFVNTSVSIVRVYAFGTPAVETSTFRYFVIRP